ncbi:MAG: redox-regulated ATPase YchF [Candidatus Nitrosocosmicus sp.]
MIIGLLGKANVGKSTFFNSATDLSVQVANFPFTTIDPNIGIAFVRVDCVCKEMGVLDNPINSRCINGARFIPVKLIDIAGLVPGAHSGKGLGNKFLDDARQSDVIIHVVDISGSTDEEGKPVSLGSGNPLSDIEFVENEFDLWIQSLILKDWDKVVRESENLKQRIEHTISKRLSGLSISEKVVRNAINTVGLNKKPLDWDKKDLLVLCRQIRLTSKPIIIAANKADLPSSDQNISKLKTLNRLFFTCVSEAELLLKRALEKNIIYYLPGDPDFEIKNSGNISDKQLNALNKVSKILKKFDSTGIQKILNYACFDILNNIVVYPVEDEFKFIDKKGNVLPDARIVSKNTTAKELANLIHNELGKGFLYAIDARSKQRIGAEHVLKNNDIVKIVSTASRN